MSLPSNFSLQEVIKYSAMPEEVRISVSTIFDVVTALEVEVRDSDRRIELLVEDVTNLRIFAQEVMKACKDHTKCKELKDSIEESLSNHNIEL